jgi:DNA invertase Pin-like site-specific DNA recombinase
MKPPAPPRFVAYYRVSTDRQGRSGFGLDAQREAVAGQVHRAGGAIVADFTEIESGKRADRPELRAALAEAKRHRATLIIARLDRLSRNMAFIANLMDARVDFIACDNLHATRLTLHILAAVAEHEREMISARKEAALAIAKARGVRLGNPRRQFYNKANSSYPLASHLKRSAGNGPPNGPQFRFSSSLVGAPDGSNYRIDP